MKQIDNEFIFSMWNESVLTDYSLMRGLLLMMFPPFKIWMQKSGCGPINEISGLNSKSIPIKEIQEAVKKNRVKVILDSDEWNIQINSSKNRLSLIAFAPFVERPAAVRVNHKNHNAIPDIDNWEPNGIVVMKIDLLADLREIKKQINEYKKMIFGRISKGRKPKAIQLKHNDIKILNYFCSGKTASHRDVKDLYKGKDRIEILYRDDVKRIRKFIDPHGIAKSWHPNK